MNVLQENHGIGIPSVKRVAAKYHGTVMIDDSDQRKFIVKVLLLLMLKLLPLQITR